MKQRVTITIKSRDAHYSVRGEMERAGGVTRLVYGEPDGLEMGNASTTLELSERAAVLTRSGAVRSAFRFEPGTPHSSVYETPHGSFPAEVVTHALRHRLDDRGGLVELRYTLTIGGAADEHRLKLLVRTEEKP